MNDSPLMNVPLTDQERGQLNSHLAEVFAFGSRCRILCTPDRVSAIDVVESDGIEPLVMVRHDRDGWIDTVPAAVLEPLDYGRRFNDYDRVIVHRVNVFPNLDGGIPTRWYRPRPRAGVVTGITWGKYDVRYLAGEETLLPSYALQLFDR